MAAPWPNREPAVIHQQSPAGAGKVDMKTCDEAVQRRHAATRRPRPSASFGGRLSGPALKLQS